MYNQIEDILLNISIVIATVWIVKRFWGSFFEEKQNSILSVSLWIVYCIFQFFFGYHNGRLQIFATILNILLILSIAMVAYQSRGKEKYFLLATFYAGWSLIEVFVFSLINSFDIGESQQFLILVGVAVFRFGVEDAEEFDKFFSEFAGAELLHIIMEHVLASEDAGIFRI